MEFTSWSCDLKLSYKRYTIESLKVVINDLERRFFFIRSGKIAVKLAKETNAIESTIRSDGAQLRF